MTKEELQKELDLKGIKYDKRFGVPKLQELRNNLPDKKDNIIDLNEHNGVLLNNESTITIVSDEVIETKPPVIIANEVKKSDEVIREIRKNADYAKFLVDSKKPKSGMRYGKIIYDKIVKDNAVEVYEKISGKFIRVYTLERHGDDYAKLANMFIDGRNNR